MLENESFLAGILGGKNVGTPYPLERTKARLGWLAQQMRQHGQTIFYLERLQPDWLPKRQRALYQWSVSLVVVLLFVLGFVLVYGLGGALVVVLLGEQRSQLPFALVMPVLGLAWGLVLGMVYVLLRLWGLKENAEIEPAEAITWSWESLVSGLRRWLVGELFFGLLGGLLYWLLYGWLYGLLSGLLSGLLYGLLSGLLSGVSKKQLTKGSLLSPNEGIRRSIINGLRVGLLSGLVGGLGWGLVSGLLFGELVGRPVGWLVGGLFGGLVGGLFGGLYAGLGAALSHYTLRFWLWRRHDFPWKAVPFLEDATTRILLRRVGGGYSFVHRLILDYFADLEPPTRTGAATQPPSA